MPLNNEITAIGAGLASASASWLALVKSRPSSVSSSATLTAPPVDEASDAVILSVKGALNDVCIRGHNISAVASSCLTSSIRHLLAPPTKVQTALKMLIVGRLNCIAKTHRPATIWTCFLLRYLWFNNHNVAWQIFLSRSLLPPRMPCSPSISAPSSSMRASAVFRFFAEDSTFAELHNCSANLWHSPPPASVCGGSNFSAAQKLSK